ncbi:MAG: hypothetical protein UU21_C0001G0101 [Candidatus Levybacteria bacterium GW2011_GWA2_40_8]|nr:MAG: hypothetical protein UU21_C0001G0101 [Candidatus Levybacteria bacterium GW2011_GWA2_40_8]
MLETSAGQNRFRAHGSSVYEAWGERPRSQALGLIRDLPDTSEIGRWIRQEDLEIIHKLPGFSKWIAKMLRDYPLTSFALAITLASRPVDSIEGAENTVKPYETGVPIEIQPGYRGWYLCDASEGRMISSIRTGAYVVLKNQGEPLLLTKFIGRRAAFCLQSFSVAEGFAFVEGNWYGPIDGNTKSGLNKAFDEGRSVMNLPSGEWALLRGADRAKAAEYKTLLNQQPLRIPGEVFSRQAFRREMYQSYSG